MVHTAHTNKNMLVVLHELITKKAYIFFIFYLKIHLQKHKLLILNFHNAINSTSY